MPTFILHIPIDLHKLFQYRTIATSTFRGKSRGIVEMAVDVAFVFIVRVLGTKQCRAEGTCEMLYMEFLVCMTRF
jgi:hypothetical protein